MDLTTVEAGFLSAGLPATLVTELLDAYTEAKRRHHLGDHRPQAVEGGRFSEALFRILQHETGQPVTPLTKSLPKVDSLLVKFENAVGSNDSVRIHLPRTLKLIYDIRNKRDIAHLTDGIDPNRQDSALVIGNMDWAMAELVRLHHGVSANEAQRIIEDLVTKEVPAIQEIDGHPVLLAKLAPRDQALLLLYRVGAAGTTVDELAGWLRVDRKDNLRARLRKLDTDQLVFIHPTTARVYLTDKGIREVETRRLARPV